MGEIVLVVIGNLIAQSLKRWDQPRNERMQVALSLTNLRSDLEQQLALLEQLIKSESDFFNNVVSIINHYARNKSFSNMDSLLPKLNSLASRRTFNPINTTYRELISTGKIGLIQNDSLKRGVMRYYNNLERINLVVSNNNARLVDGLFNPVLFEQTLYLADINDPEVGKINREIFDAESVKALGAASEKILSDPQKALHLFNVLEERFHVALGHKELYIKVQSETHLLRQAIKSELEKNL